MLFNDSNDSKYVSWCLGARHFSPPWLLGNGHQVQLGLATDVTALTACIGHANGGLHGHHWLWPSNGGWCMCGHLCMCALAKISIKGTLGLTFWLTVVCDTL